jgi:hypothetical protein
VGRRVSENFAENERCVIFVINVTMLERRRRITLVLVAQVTKVVTTFSTENETLATKKAFASKSSAHGRLSNRICIGLEDMVLFLAQLIVLVIGLEKCEHLS